MSNVVGLEIPIAWTSDQLPNPSFDISSDKLHGANTVLANTQLYVSGTTVNWATVRHINAADPQDPQDLSTMKYVDDQLALQIQGHVIEDEGTPLAQQPNLDFQGDLVDASDTVGTTIVKIATGFSVAGELLTLSTGLAVPTPLPVGNDGQILTADSLEDLGLKWVDDPGSPLTLQGDLLTRDATTNIRLPIGNPNDVLTVNAGGTDPEWAQPAQTGHTIQDEGSNLTQRINLNFVGALVLATDGGAGPDSSIVTIDGALTDLTNVDTTGQVTDNVLSFNGTIWVPQLLTRSQLPTEIAYQDEINTFTENNFFNAGITMGASGFIDMNDTFISNTKYMDFNEQSANVDVPIGLTTARIWFDDAPNFGQDNPNLSVWINRGGTVQKKPIISSETVFALNSFSNGMFTQETGTRLNDPAVADNMRVQIFNENSQADTFDVVLDGQIFVIVSPDVSINSSNTSPNLTTGTAIVPNTYYVWMRNISGTPTIEFATDSFPAGTDFAVLGIFSFQDKASVLADGPIFAHSPDYEIFDEITRGHLSHLNDRIASLDSSYREGIDITTFPVAGDPEEATVSFTTTAGEAFELHLENIESFDSSTGYMTVQNEGTQNPGEITRVANLGVDLVGMTLADQVTVYEDDNDRINVVIYTVHVDTEPNQTNFGINLPTGKYTGASGQDDTDAINDINNFAVRTIPIDFRGIALLAYEIVIKLNTTGPAFTVLSVKDLRGQIPGASSSGGGAIGGATELDQLTDVTIGIDGGGIALDVDQILKYDGTFWRNVVNPAGLLAAQNEWTDFQDYSEILIPADPATTIGRFYVKRLDANNTGLFVKLEQAGAIAELQIA